jgi:hypothetical protein
LTNASKSLPPNGRRLNPRDNLAPTQPVPVIRQNPKEPIRELLPQFGYAVQQRGSPPTPARRLDVFTHLLGMSHRKHISLDTSRNKFQNEIFRDHEKAKRGTRLSF